MAKSNETTAAVMVRRDNLPAPVQTFEEIEKLGKIFDQSQMFGITQQGQGLILAMTCVMQRITPLEFMQTYHIVEGRPTMRADAMLAKLIEDGGDYKIVERTPEVASVWMKCGNREGTFTMTHEDVKAEPFYWKKDGKTPKDNYATPRKRMQMLWARVTSDGVRVVDPGSVKGTYSPEEVQDFTEDDRVSRAKTVAAEVVPPAMTAKPATEAKEKAKPVTQQATVATPPTQAPVEKAEPVAKQEVLEPQVIPPAKTTAAAVSNAGDTIMPCGKFQGKKFSEFDDKILKFVVNTVAPSIDSLKIAESTVADTNASMEAKTRAESVINMNKITDAHRKAAQAVLDERAAK